MLLCLIDLVILSWGSDFKDWCTCVYLYLYIVRILINIGMSYSLNLNNC